MKESKILTAKEWFETNKINVNHRHPTYEDMVEFAQIHVQAALEAANKNAEVRITENALMEGGCCYSSYDDGVITITTDEQSILNAFPLEKIK